MVLIYFFTFIIEHSSNVLKNAYPWFAACEKTHFCKLKNYLTPLQELASYREQLKSDNV